MNWRKVVVVGICITAPLAAATSGALGSDSPGDQATFGTVPPLGDAADWPDFIQAECPDGGAGGACFVKKSEMLDRTGFPNNPAEAVTYQGRGALTLYDRAGVVIGTFPVGATTVLGHR